MVGAKTSPLKQLVRLAKLCCESSATARSSRQGLGLNHFECCSWRFLDYAALYIADYGFFVANVTFFPLRTACASVRCADSGPALPCYGTAP
jgi:hypothetical protein